MKKQFYILAFLTVLINTGMGIVIPVLPNLLKSNGFTIVGLSLPFTALILARLVAKPYAGKLIKLLGTRFTLQATFALFAVAFFLYPLMDTPTLFIAVRVLEGIAEGIAAVVLMDTAINLTRGSREKGKLMGVFSASFGVGFIVGPAAGSLIYKFFGAGPMFYFGTVCGVVGVFLSTFIKSEASRTGAENKVSTISLMRSSLRYLPFFLPNIIRRVAFFSMMIILPLFLVDQLGIAAADVGFFFSLSAVFTSIMMPIFGKWSDGYGAAHFAGYGLLVMGITLACFGLINNIVVFVIFYVIETIAFALMLPAGTKIFADIVEDDAQKPLILGLFGSYIEVSTLVVAIVLPIVYSVSATLAWASLGLFSALSAVPFFAKDTLLGKFKGASA